jgi:hypothetical protein
MLEYWDRYNQLQLVQRKKVLLHPQIFSIFALITILDHCGCKKIALISWVNIFLYHRIGFGCLVLTVTYLIQCVILLPLDCMSDAYL